MVKETFIDLQDNMKLLPLISLILLKVVEVSVSEFQFKLLNKEKDILKIEDLVEILIHIWQLQS